MSLRDLLPPVENPGPRSQLKKLYDYLTADEIGELVELFNDPLLTSSQVAFVCNMLAEKVGFEHRFQPAKIQTYRRERRYEP
jgi:hypothetical protein